MFIKIWSLVLTTIDRHELISNTLTMIKLVTYIWITCYCSFHLRDISETARWITPIFPFVSTFTYNIIVDIIGLFCCMFKDLVTSKQREFTIFEIPYVEVPKCTVDSSIHLILSRETESASHHSYLPIILSTLPIHFVTIYYTSTCPYIICFNNLLVIILHIFVISSKPVFALFSWFVSTLDLASEDI